jgi:hypothetical protein
MLDGNLLAQGKRRLDILANLYRLPRIAFPGVAAECDRIKMPSKGEFLHEYLFRSKPVIIEGGFLSYCNLSNVLIHLLLSENKIFYPPPTETAEFFSLGKNIVNMLRKRQHWLLVLSKNSMLYGIFEIIFLRKLVQSLHYALSIELTVSS